MFRHTMSSRKERRSREARHGGSARTTECHIRLQVYTLVALAAPDQVRKVADVRADIGLTRATIAAHVTVRGTFYAIESLKNLRGLLCATAIEQLPVRVEFNSSGWRFRTDAAGLHHGTMPCETTPELVALNKAFNKVIRPRSKNAYPDEYSAHLTLCQDCSDQQIEKARSLAADLDIGTGFEIDSVHLMGRVGPAFGGEWKPIESFTLGTKDNSTAQRFDSVPLVD